LTIVAKALPTVFPLLLLSAQINRAIHYVTKVAPFAEQLFFDGPARKENQEQQQQHTTIASYSS
jgi:hypothetical protein